MEQLLVWAWVYLLTLWVSKLQKYFPKLSLRLFVAIICLGAGAVYYFLQQNNPELLKQTTEFIGGVFATSQAIFLIVDKFLPKTSPILPSDPTS